MAPPWRGTGVPPIFMPGMAVRSIFTFILLAYVVSWGLFALAKWGLGVQSTLGWTVVSALFMLGPGIAALLHRRWNKLAWRDLGVVREGIRWNWMGIAVLIAVALPPLTLLFNWLLGDLLHLAAFGHTALTKAMVLEVAGEQAAAMGAQGPGKLADLPLNAAAILGIALIAGAVAGCTVNFGFAMGEELGWRGTLFHALRPMGLWPQVLLTGAVWGLWHAPLILRGHNYPDHPVAGVFFMCILTTALAVPMAWVRFRSRCVWAAGVLHGSINGTAGATMLFTNHTSSLAGGPAGISAVLALLVAIALLFLLDPGFRRAFSHP